MKDYKIGELTIEEGNDGVVAFSAGGLEYMCHFSKIRLSGRYIVAQNLTAKMPVPAQLFEDVPNHAITSIDELARYLDRVITAMDMEGGRP